MLRSLTEVAHAYPWFFPAVATLLGACIGSFLNVVIYRVPAKQSIVLPGSHCACGAPIGWRDNLPILSWMLLRGRARCCGRPFSIRYPLVEALTAGLFLACALRLPPAVAVCGAVFLSGLIAATFIDLDHMIIPDACSIGLALAGVLLSLFVPALHGQYSDSFGLDSIRSGVDAVVGMVVGSGVILWIALLAEAILKKEAMGFGDVKFLGAIGAFCGWHGALFAIFGGAAVGSVWMTLAILWQKLAGRPAPGAPRAETAEGDTTDLGFGVQVPFGPMLAIAAALYLLVFHHAVERWFSEVAPLF